mmetsp:Transcript_65235/g.132538  ORF Transcript_65235/g.132538 Transcript_65235/m.132538 type:complete len:187 (+) Transcript_65235:51-611(+)
MRRCSALLPLLALGWLVGGPSFLRSSISTSPRTSRTRLGASGATQTVLDALKEFDGKFEEPFELLGLDDPECPKKEIRAAFRQVARVEHPDVSDREDAEERFRRISLAYELLIDDGGRAMLLEALEKDADDLQDLEVKKNTMDEANESWDEQWVEDEFTAVSRTVFLIFMAGGIGSVIWWFGFEHE